VVISLGATGPSYHVTKKEDDCLYCVFVLHRKEYNSDIGLGSLLIILRCRRATVAIALKVLID
jgi:hypothetical protein